MNAEDFDFSDQFLQELNQLDEQIKADNRKEEIRKKRAEGGKLGGRPKIDNSKKKQVNVKFSENDYLQVLEVANSYGMTLQDFIRRRSLDVPLRDGKRNEILLEYRTNFKRISNIFRKDIWTESEKKKLKNELEEVIKLLQKNIS
jgi:DNA invertase Pin-like site-specific DNA recombinase